MELFDVVRDPKSRISSLVFEYVDKVNFKVLYPTLNDMNSRYYLRVTILLSISVMRNVLSIVILNTTTL